MTTSRLVPGAVGAAFGFLLTASGLGDYDTIHGGLLLEDAYIYLMMAATIGTAAPLLWLLQRCAWRTLGGDPLALPQETPERRHVLGGAVFGVGFAVTAACPGITVAMVATGRPHGLIVLIGILAGLHLQARTRRAPAFDGTDVRERRRRSGAAPARPQAPAITPSAGSNSIP